MTFNVIYAKKLAEEVVETKIKKHFRTIADAREEVEAIPDVIAYRVFEGGIRIYSKKIEKRG